MTYDYDSFYLSNIREKNGYCQILKSKYDAYMCYFIYLNEQVFIVIFNHSSV